MINQESIRAISASRLNERFLKPLADTYSFARIPQTVRSLLIEGEPEGVPTGPIDALREQYDAVVLLFVDAFGWRFFEQYADRYPFLQRIIHDGGVCKLTSQFPSTTAAHVTTIHTGLPVAASGVWEWFYYEPQLDAMIAPLLFSFAGDKQRDTLTQTGVDARELFPRSTLYHDLNAHTIPSFIFQHRDYAQSPYTLAVTDGAKIVSYRTLPEALVSLTELIRAQQQRSYYFLYFDGIDSTCHTHGPESPHAAAEIALFLTALERILHPQLSTVASRTLLLITADHGQIAIDPATTIYLNQLLPNLHTMMRTTRAGRPLVPGGSSRDMFLYIKDEHLEEAQALLQAALGERAEVMRVTDLIARGVFGTTPPSATFLSRVGNLAILPYGNESVWWYEKGRFDQPFKGNHGGLTPEELETPLLVLPYGP